MIIECPRMSNRKRMNDCNVNYYFRVGTRREDLEVSESCLCVTEDKVDIIFAWPPNEKTFSTFERQCDCNLSFLWRGLQMRIPESF